MPDEGYEINVGSNSEGALKLAHAVTRREIEERDVLNAPPNFAGNILTRGARFARYGLRHPRVMFRHIRDSHLKEYYRHTGNERNYQAIVNANLGLATGATIDPEVAQHTRELRREAKASVEEIKQVREATGGTGLAGDLLSGEITGPLRTYVLDTVLRPAVTQLSAATTNDEREAVETFIQQRLSDYIRDPNNQNDDTIRQYFGRNNTPYGEISQMFASDITNVAQKIINDGKAHDLATNAIDDQIKLKLFKTRQGEESELNQDVASRLYALGKRNRFLGIGINAVTIGAGSAIAVQLARYGLKGALVNAGFAAPIAGVLTSAVYKNVQERYLYGKELKAVARDLETNMVAGADSPRRHELEAMLRGDEAQEGTRFMVRSSELINGGGQDLILGTPRRSIDAIITSGNLDEMMSRYGEIRSRLNAPREQGRGSFRKLGRIIYDTQETTAADSLMRHAGTPRLELIRKMAELRQAAIAKGVDPDRDGISTRTGTSIVGDWSERLTQTREQQQRQYVRQREKRAFGKALGTAAIGALTTLGTQEEIALVARGAFNHPVKETYLEKLVDTSRVDNLLQWAGAGKAADAIGFERFAPQNSAPNVLESFKKLYGKPSDSLTLSPDIKMNVNTMNGQTLVGFTDGQGNPMNIPSFASLTKDGHVVLQGNPTQVDQILQANPKLKDALDAANIKPQLLTDETYNLSKKFDTLANGNMKESGRLGRVVYDFDPAGSPTNTSGVDVVTMRTDYVDPLSGKQIVGKDMAFGYDRTTGELMLDRYNDQNIAWGVTEADVLAFNQEAQSDGFTFNAIPDTHKETVMQPTFGANGEWEKYLKTVDRQWYAYDTPKSELNELMLRTRKDGDAIILGANMMEISRQSNLTPAEINVQNIIKEGKLGWAFSLPGYENKPFMVMDTADGFPPDGMLRLDPNDVDPTHVVQTPVGPMPLGLFSKIVLNPSEYQHVPNGDVATEWYTNFRGEDRTKWFHIGGTSGGTGTISAGTYSPEQNAWKSFATIRGTGVTQAEIPVPKVSEYNKFELVAPQAVEFVPPPGADAGEAPLIPIPFFPRRDLEKPVKGEIIEPKTEVVITVDPQSYGGEESAELKAKTEEAKNKAETFIRARAELIDDTEKDEAVAKVKSFVELPESKAINPIKAEENLEELWEFVYRHADWTAFTTDDGTVTPLIHSQIDPIINGVILDPAERTEYAQVIGKLLTMNPTLLALPDRERDTTIKNLTLAYQVIRDILSPI